MKTLAKILFLALTLHISLLASAAPPKIRYHAYNGGALDIDVPSRQAACDAWGKVIGFTNARVKPGWDTPSRWGGQPNTPIICLYTSPYSANDERSPGGAYCGSTWTNGNSFTVDKTTETCGCQPPSRYMPDVDTCVSLSEVPNPPPSNPKNNGRGCPHCGQPINPTNGNMWHRENDYDVPSNNGLGITRYYNSSVLSWGANDQHLFGSHWTSWLDMSLRPEVTSPTSNFKCWKRADNNLVFCDGPPVPTSYQPIPDSVSVLRPDGKRFYFSRNGFAFVGDGEVKERLTAIYDSSNQNIISWKLSTPDVTEENYSSTGRLLSVKEKGNDLITLTYSDGTTNNTALGRWPTNAPICTNVPIGNALPAGRLLCATDASGHQLNFEYNSTGNITKVIDANGHALFYEYDGLYSNGCTSTTDSKAYWCQAGNLTRVIYQDGNARTYYYNEASRINKGSACSGAKASGTGFGHLVNALTGLVDENSDRFISWDYTCDGFADISELNGGIEKVSIDYSYLRSGNTFTYVTHYLGAQDFPTTSTQAYGFSNIIGAAKNTDVSGQCYECGDYSRRYYDSYGNLISDLDWNGNYRCFAYDTSRNLEIIRVEGTTSSSCSTLLVSASLTLPTRKISTEWHPQLSLPTRIAEPKRVTTYVYDDQANLISMSIQATADLTGAKGFAATAVGPSRTWSFTYNGQGKLSRKKGPRTDLEDVTSYEYDSAENLTAVINSLGQRTEYSDYDQSGRVGKIRSPNGKLTLFAYTPRGWVNNVTMVDDTSRLETNYEYDKTGQLARIVNEDGSWIAYTYDKAHRLTSLVDNLGNSITYTLDLAGNRLREQIKDPNGTLSRQISRTFKSDDERYRERTMKRHTNPSAACLAMFAFAFGGPANAQVQDTTTTFTYDALGNVLSVSRPLSRRTTFVYDQLNRTTQQTVALGSTTLLTSISYDGEDQVASVTDPRNLVTTYTVDGLGNRTQLGSPDTRGTGYTVDQGGNVLSITDARGKTSSFQYDALNRVVRAQYQSGTASQFEYDGGPGGPAVEIGNLTRITDESGSTTFTHDMKRSVLTKTQVVDAGGISAQFTLHYSYGITGSAIGKLERVTYPSGARVNYSYDAGGRVNSVTINPSDGSGGTSALAEEPLITDIAYTPTGNVQSWRWGNSALPVSQRAYDLDGRLTSYPTDLLGTVRTLTYNAASLITAYTHTGKTNSAQYDQTFAYDTADRLTSFTLGGVTTTYTYDANGNRIQQTSPNVTYNYSSTSNQLSSATFVKPRTYSYDAAGNRTGDGLYIYTYSDRGRLAQVSGNAQLNMYYNALGQRVLKAGTSGSTTYVYDEDGHTIGEYSGSSALGIETVYLGDLPIAVLTPQARFYVLADQLSAPLVLSQSDGAIVWDWRNRDPFGNNAPIASPVMPQYDLRFPGQVADAETGLFYNYFRDYDPGIGRYIQSDPIGLDGEQASTYAYVGGNPVAYADSFGLAKTGWKDRAMDPNSEGCKNLLKTIANNWADYERQVTNLVNNPKNLPYWAPGFSGPGGAFKDSVWGHEQLRDKYKADWERNKMQYAKRCLGDDPPPPPAPAQCVDPNNGAPPGPNMNAAKNAAGWTSGLGLTYWIISEGSRVLFPPRNLIPVP